jgi:CDGSH-type Zn-finger protein
VTAPDDGLEPQLRICPDGPLLVRGARTVTTDDGVEHAVDRPVIALCRCGLTQSVPYCDGTHKAASVARRRGG